jgi:hypothetical protein
LPRPVITQGPLIHHLQPNGGPFHRDSFPLLPPYPLALLSFPRSQCTPPAAAAIGQDPPTPVKVAMGGARPLPVLGVVVWFPSPPATLAAQALGHQRSNLWHAPLLPRSMVVPVAPVTVLGGAAQSPSPLVSSHCWTIALEDPSPLPYHLGFMVGLAEEVPSNRVPEPRSWVQFPPATHFLLLCVIIPTYLVFPE